jgi:membrane protease YdiL (CAAX protease family)
MNIEFTFVGLTLTNELVITYSLLCAALVSVIIPRTGHLWVILFSFALASGLAFGIVEIIALPFILLMAGAAYLFAKDNTSKWQTTTGGTIVVLMALAFGFHAVPGFHSPLVIQSQFISSGAIEYKAYANFDKALISLLIIGLIVNKRPKGAISTQHKLNALSVFSVISVVTLMVGIFTQLIAFDPKLVSLFFGWGLLNILFSVMAEESLFRGFYQYYLGEKLKTVKFGSAITVVSSGLLFGLFHFGGGLAYIVVASMMGIAYAYVYHKTNSIAATVLSHFAFNAIHFLFFTYPAFSAK